jgi:hypothetical protein
VAKSIRGFTLGLGRIWRLLADLEVPWETAIRAVSVRSIVPCGLPGGIAVNRSVVASLPGPARVALNGFIGQGDLSAPPARTAGPARSNRAKRWMRDGEAEWKRRFCELSREEFHEQFGAMELFAELLAHAWNNCEPAGEMSPELLGAVEVRFDTTGWPETFHATPRAREPFLSLLSEGPAAFLLTLQRNLARDRGAVVSSVSLDWTDPRRYVPEPLPVGWRLLTDGATKQVFVVKERLRIVVSSAFSRGCPVVEVAISCRSAGVPPSGEEIAILLAGFRGCGVFREEHHEGATRIFTAPYRYVHAPGDTREDELIARAKPFVLVAAQIAVSLQRPLRDVCVLLSLDPPLADLPDGVALPVESLREKLPREWDAAGVWQRLDEPREPHECALLVKQGDNLEVVKLTMEHLIMSNQPQA